MRVACQISNTRCINYQYPQPRTARGIQDLAVVRRPPESYEGFLGKSRHQEYEYVLEYFLV